MPENDIQFSDGDAYEQSMGVWSRLARSASLPFVNAPPGCRWLDVGSLSMSGSFTPTQRWSSVDTRSQITSLCSRFVRGTRHGRTPKADEMRRPRPRYAPTIAASRKRAESCAEPSSCQRSKIADLHLFLAKVIPSATESSTR